MGYRRSNGGLLNVPVGIGCFTIGIGVMLATIIGKMPWEGALAIVGMVLSPLILVAVVAFFTKGKW